MNLLDRLKAMQIAAMGDDHPYRKAEPDLPPLALVTGDYSDRSNPLKSIKQAQQANAEKTGDNPYVVFDPAKPGADRTIDLKPQSLEHYQAAMDADLNSLKVLKTLPEKAAAKKTMVETYLRFVGDYIDSGHAYPNAIAVQVMIWLFDIFDIERALDLALRLIKQGVHQMPPRFDRRDLETFVCDALYDWANALLKQDQSASPYLDTLAATLGNDNWSLSPPVKSKIFAMLAKHKKRLGEFAECLALCEKAEAANPEGAGVKGMKTEALAEINKSAEPK